MLCLPCIIIAFTGALLESLGVRCDPALNNFYHWAVDFIQGVSLFDVVMDTTAIAFSIQFRTMPIEFQGFVQFYICLLALGSAQTPVRLVKMIMIEIYFSFIGRWDMILFNSGMLCCQLHII